MDLTKLDAYGAYEILIAINQLRRRLRDQDYATYSRELREFAQGITETGRIEFGPQHP